MSRLQAAWNCLMGKPTVYRLVLTDTLKTDCEYRIFDSTVFVKPSDDIDLIYANEHSQPEAVPTEH